MLQPNRWLSFIEDKFNKIWRWSCLYKGLPWWLSGKEYPYRWRRHRFDPWIGKIPWRRKCQPTPIFLPGEFHGQRSLAGYSPWGYKESDMTEWLPLSLFFKPLSLWLFGTAVRANMCNHNENTVPNFKNTIINYCLTIFNWPMLPILNSVLFVLQYVSVQALIHHHHNIKKK